MNRFASALLVATILAGAAHAAPENGPLLFPNSDFERSSLENWRPEGNAFNHQPTSGDNTRYRDQSFRALQQGNWWIGTYEKFRGEDGQRAGDVQRDAPTGGLMSQSFLIEGPYITFLIGGGRGKDVGVQLVVGGNIVYDETGGGVESMRRVYWDVRDRAQKKAFIYIYDNSSKPWGHINADDFRYAETAPRELLFENSDFEKGDLSNWTASGDAYAHQPTKGDNAAVRRADKQGAEPQGTWWVGTFEKYRGADGETPGAEQGDTPTGTLRSVPFTITGPVIAFRVGGSAIADCGVRLLVDDREMRVARGLPSEWMVPAVWLVDDLKGKEAIIEIFDNSSQAWGHINADDFHYGRVDLRK